MLFDEGRLAAVANNHQLAGAGSLTLARLAGETLALTPSVGTTTLELWPPHSRPTRTVAVDNIDEWLTVIAAGGAVGLTPESTAFTHPHPGVRFLPVLEVPDLPVWLAWSRVAMHPDVAPFVELARGWVERERAEGSIEPHEEGIRTDPA